MCASPLAFSCCPGRPSLAPTAASSSSGTKQRSGNRLRGLPLYLTEAHIEKLLTPADALAAIEACFERQARGAIRNRPRTRTRAGEGVLAVMSAVDEELGLAGLKSYAALPAGTPFVVVLFDLSKAELAAVIEADRMGQLRTGAASGVAAKHLAKPGRAHARRHRLRLAGREPGRVHPRGAARDRAGRRLLPDREGPARVLREGRRRARREPPRRRPSRMSSSRSRPRTTPFCAASGCSRARSSVPSARTGRRRASSTTSSSSGPSSSAATRSSRRRSSRETWSSPSSEASSTGSRCTSSTKSSRASSRDAARRTTSSSSSRTGSPPGTSRSAPPRSSSRTRGSR